MALMMILKRIFTKDIGGLEKRKYQRAPSSVLNQLRIFISTSHFWGGTMLSCHILLQTCNSQIHRSQGHHHRHSKSRYHQQTWNMRVGFQDLRRNKACTENQGGGLEMTRHDTTTKTAENVIQAWQPGKIGIIVRTRHHKCHRQLLCSIRRWEGKEVRWYTSWYWRGCCRRRWSSRWNPQYPMTSPR